LAKKNSGTVVLRIDDFDAVRTRDEFVQDIFSCLHWLGISPDEGPKNLEDFKKNYSQKNKQEKYFHYIEDLQKRGLLYACECSRSQKENFTEKGAYKGICRDKIIKFIRTQHSLRLRTNSAKENWQATLNDFVVWTKEDTAAYQLVSVVEDLSDNIDLIVRGEDLRDSSAAQTYLASCLGQLSWDKFQKIKFIHHPLVVDSVDASKKLSKSLSAYSLKEMISAGLTPSDFLKQFEAWSKNLLYSV
jgi:glutamyl-tRNA synthetase